MQWGFREELAPIEAEINRWKMAGGLVKWSPGDGYELYSAMGDLYYQINSDRVGEVVVKDHLAGTPSKQYIRLSAVIRDIAAIREACFPIKVSDLERWKSENPVDSAYLEVKAAFVAGEVARGVHPDQAEALFNLTWQGDTSDKAAEIAAEIAAALEPEGTAADIAAREALADVVLAGAEPLEKMVLEVAEGMRL